jgi:serine protease Do
LHDNCPSASSPDDNKHVRIAICASVLICGLALSARAQSSAPLLQLGQQSASDCGWIGVQVRPITAAFAASLGMAQPYGAIFERPEPNSPAAEAKIMEGDVVTTINGVAFTRAEEFAMRIAAMAPGSLIHLKIFRNGQLMEIGLTVGASKCPVNGVARRPDDDRGRNRSG